MMSGDQPKLVYLDADPSAVSALSLAALHAASLGSGRGALAARHAIAAYDEHKDDGHRAAVAAARASIRASFGQR